MATILIWEDIPEKTRMFVIPEEKIAPIRHYLTEAHGNYLNCSELNPGLEFVNQAVSEYDCQCGHSDSIGLFLPFEVDMKHPLEYQVGEMAEFITHVYHSGFVL